MRIDAAGARLTFFRRLESSIDESEDSFRKPTEEELAEEQNQDIDEDNVPFMGM